MYQALILTQQQGILCFLKSMKMNIIIFWWHQSSSTMAHTHFMPAESCLLFSKAQHITPCLPRFLQTGWAVGNAHQPEESSCSVNASFLCFLSSPHYHFLPCCHFYDKLEFLVLGERNLTTLSGPSLALQESQQIMVSLTFCSRSGNIPVRKAQLQSQLVPGRQQLLPTGTL